MTTKDEALRMAREALTWISDVYVHEDDEVGECASCHERSYNPHAPYCKRKLALDAIDAALAEPQGEMPELPPMAMTIAGKDKDAGHWYTADQMLAYGRACAEAEREQCAKQLDALGCDHCAAALRYTIKEAKQ